MNTSELITLFATLISVFAVLISLFTFYNHNRKNTKYNEEKSKAEIEGLRSNFESRIYELTDRLMSGEERWKDVNHLFINSSVNKKDKYLSSSAVNPDRFLDAMGIDQQSLKVIKDQIFVLTPFHSKFYDEYHIIEDSCKELGLRVSRGDEKYIKGDILSHILQRICESKIVIANITGRNPNVFYELGLAHALGKPVIIISQGLDEIPFDLRSKQILVYDHPMELSKKLRDTLIRVIIDNPNN